MIGKTLFQIQFQHNVHSSKQITLRLFCNCCFIKRVKSILFSYKLIIQLISMKSIFESNSYDFAEIFRQKLRHYKNEYIYLQVISIFNDIKHTFTIVKSSGCIYTAQLDIEHSQRYHSFLCPSGLDNLFSHSFFFSSAVAQFIYRFSPQ